MPDLMNVNPLSKFMALMVGPNGSGKSIAIASWKKKGSIYFFDYDGRMASVANWYRQRGLKSGELQYDTYGPANVYQAYEKLSQFAESCPHAAIVIDSFTAVTVSAVTFSLRQRSGKGASHKDAPKNSKGNMMIPDWDEWNAEATYVTMLLDLSKQIAAQGTAVFWTAHPVQRTKIEAGSGGSVGKVTVQTKYAAFGMKSDSLIPIYFNEIYSFGIEQNYEYPEGQQLRRICYTQPDPSTGIAAKTALNISPKIDWTDKDFYSLFEKDVNEGLKLLDTNKGEEINEVKNENVFKI